MSTFLFKRQHRYIMVPLVVLVVVLAGVVSYFVWRPAARLPSVTSSVRIATPPPPVCDGSGRTVLRPLPTDPVRDTDWKAESPPDDVTYDLNGVTSTAYPAKQSVFEVGAEDAALRTCIIGGTVLGQADDQRTWQYYHDEWNAGCVKVIARAWAHVRGLRCDNVEDGVVIKESSVHANNMSIYISGTYLSRIRDDCMENDFTVGGVLYDNLWEECHNGISERPWRDEHSWSSPSDELLILDRMLIGLYKTPNDDDGEPAMGHNALFKWSKSGNRVVIKCSIFKVEAVSVNGEDSMAMPPGTVVDDSGCPDNPSTIVWLGAGKYPGGTAGMRVVRDPDVWTDAVRAWKTAHGY